MNDKLKEAVEEALDAAVAVQKAIEEEHFAQQELDNDECSYNYWSKKNDKLELAKFKESQANAELLLVIKEVALEII